MVQPWPALRQLRYKLLTDLKLGKRKRAQNSDSDKKCTLLAQCISQIGRWTNCWGIANANHTVHISDWSQKRGATFFWVECIPLSSNLQETGASLLGLSEKVGCAPGWPPVIISMEHKKYTCRPPDNFANAFNNGHTDPADCELMIYLIFHFFCCLYFLMEPHLIYNDCPVGRLESTWQI